MPSTITHEYYYRDIYEYTSDAFKKTYPKDFYRTYSAGSQGHDAYFFLDFWNLPQFKKKCDRASSLQDERFQNLCVDLIKSIIEDEGTDNKQIKLLLYGYILHHLLDSYVHPYIIYETENFKIHAPVESYLDERMIKEREKTDPTRFPVHKMIPKIPRFSKETKDILDKSFLKIYGIPNFGVTYERALRQVPIFLRLFRYDPLGIKMLGYRLVDFTHISKTDYYWLSYKDKFPGYERFLNDEHREWYHPNTGEISTSSFKELYDRAVLEGAHIISELEDAITNKLDEKKLYKIIPKISANPLIKNGVKVTVFNCRK